MKKKQPTKSAEEERRLDEFIEYALQPMYDDGLNEEVRVSNPIGKLPDRAYCSLNSRTT